MARRDADADAIHGEVVEHVANTLDPEWDHVFAVDSRLDHGSPSEIDGHTPDVSARSDGRELVVEVETDPDADADQRETFKDWASAETQRAYVGILATDYDDWEEFETEGVDSLEE